MKYSRLLIVAASLAFGMLMCQTPTARADVPNGLGTLQPPAGDLAPTVGPGPNPGPGPNIVDTPEPSTLAIAALGGMGLAYAVHKRRSS